MRSVTVLLTQTNKLLGFYGQELQYPPLCIQEQIPGGTDVTSSAQRGWKVLF